MTAKEVTYVEAQRCAPRHLRRADPRHLVRLTRSVMELRERDMTFRAISTILELYEGVDVPTTAVRDWCWRLGFARNPNMVRGHVPPPRVKA